MKKVFNLTVLLAALMTAFVFSSCSKDDDATVSISLTKTTLTVGEALTGKITTTDKLASVTILRDGQTIAGYPLTSFGTGKPITGTDGTYIIYVEGLTAGNYTIRATDKNNKEANASFTVGGPAIVYDLTSFTAAEGDSYAYSYDGKDAGTFTITEVDADGEGFKIVLNNGNSVTIGYATPNKSFLTKDFTAISGADAAANSGATLLLYLEGKTKTIKAGQLATFSAGAVASTAKETKFAKL
ncbi:MAG: hypothetical protein LBN27_08935 [Prevotellaceae bacterium]|jgi:hypothetical protein|nr:hypothetical protein [Prevotellaceae bacterium]